MLSPGIFPKGKQTGIQLYIQLFLHLWTNILCNSSHIMHYPLPGIDTIFYVNCIVIPQANHFYILIFLQLPCLHRQPGNFSMFLQRVLFPFYSFLLLLALTKFISSLLFNISLLFPCECLKFSFSLTYYHPESFPPFIFNSIHFAAGSIFAPLGLLQKQFLFSIRIAVFSWLPLFFKHSPLYLIKFFAYFSL